MILLGVGPPLLAVAIQYPDASIEVVAAMIRLAFLAAVLGLIAAAYLHVLGYR